MNLPGILGFEVTFFEIHDDETAEVKVEEKEVEVKLAVADFEPVLATDEGEAAPEFEQELLDVGKQAGLKLPLVERFVPA